MTGTSGGDERTLPADFGSRYAARFYLIRLAVLGALVLVGALVPALTVLFHNGSHASGGIVVLLVILALAALASSVRQRGALSPVSAFAPAPRVNLLRVLVATIVRLLRRR